MPRLLDDQKRRVQGQQPQGNLKQVQRPGAVQTQSAASQPVQTQQANQPQRPAELHGGAGQTQSPQNPAQTPTQPSTQGNDVVAQAQALLSEKLQSFRGQNAGAIGDLVAQLQNREPFEYDVNADPTYQMLREIWTRDGLMAMQDTMGQAAHLTGGYGNSYAQTAGQQVYGDHMRGLAEMVPQLKEAARADYDAETDAMLRQYGILMEQDQQEYARYLDYLNQQRYDQEWQYQQERDALSDQRYDQEWAYQQERDQLSDSRYDREWEYQQGRDEIEDARYEDERDYAREQAERDYMLNLALAAYEMGDDSLVKALGINPKDYGVSYGSGGSGGSRGSGGSGGGSGSGSGSGSNGGSGAAASGNSVPTREELGDPFKKEDYTTVTANCAVFAGNGASSAEISAYLKEALNDGSITRDQYNTLMARYGNLADTGSSSSSSSGRGGGSGSNNRYNAFN